MRSVKIVLAAVTVAGAMACAAFPAAAQAPSPSGVSFNQKFVEGLRSTLNLDDEMAVFGYVFSALPDEVVVYPTENYYYWSFTANGRIIWGNFRLDAVDRDKGILNLGYFEYDENGKFQDYDGWEKAISAKDGVAVKKVSRFVYTVSYKGRTVTFRLNDVGMAPPKKEKLRADEVYIGPVFDESGVQFYVIFNKTTNHFHYVLNEDVPPPETYKKLYEPDNPAHAKELEKEAAANGAKPPKRRKPDPSVLIGRRTGFAFYVDKVNNRKILVAVNNNNARRNNYYDGPFDQLPDNYIDQTHIGRYLELAYPYLKGKIDKRGVVIGENGNRAAVGAYYNYEEEGELDFVASCRKTFKTNSAKFYACITPEGG
jgi:hypothetical protein